MAYAAVVSLKHTIETSLVNSSRISLVPPSLQIVESVYKQVHSLKEVLERLDDSSSENCSRTRVNALDGRIREAVSEFEDIVESHLSDQLLSQSEENDNGDGIQFSIDLQDLKKAFCSFNETVMDLKEEYINELCNPMAEEDDDDDDGDDEVLSRAGSGGQKSKMVGLPVQFQELKRQLMSTQELRFHVCSIVGMAGIGKTILAKEIFDDPSILSHFDCRAWAKVGRKCRLIKNLLSILAQVNSDGDQMIAEGDEDIAHYLKEILRGKRYLIVLDDVWDTRVCHYIKSLMGDNENGSRILLTTRLREVAGDVSYYLAIIYMRFLNDEESWDLLREKVFPDELCPPELKKAGKKIAKNCDGLPLTIVTVANILSKAEKSPEYWDNVAENKNLVFMEAYDKMLKVLYPSYEHLPQNLKMYFLYMGVFPQKYEIPRSKLINMWIAEGFLEPNSVETTEYFAMQFLEKLVSKNLVIDQQQSTIYSHNIKTSGIHTSFWHMCNSEAEKDKFFHVLNNREDGLAEGIKSQRRLCVYNNILFGINDVYNSMEDDCASTARSLLCFGPYHQYPVPMCFGLRLLRVLDAVKIRFYEFPIEVLNLVHLRYLSFTCNGELPPSISKLWKLQILIVHRNLSIKPCQAPSYLPKDIWDMRELKHLQIMGSNLMLDSDRGAVLPNLLTLLDVSSHSCTKEVFERIFNLRKLGIQIELTNATAEPSSCFDYLSHLTKLESLKCAISNPELRSVSLLPPASPSLFPSCLRKLHLSGLGYPWNYMTIIGSLPYLEALKLRCYAFQGPMWEIQENTFLRLQFLLIEDTDLVHWKVGGGSFPLLTNLSIRHCYKLEELLWESDVNYLQKIEVVDCNPLAVKKIKEVMLRKAPYHVPIVEVHSSWIQKK